MQFIASKFLLIVYSWINRNSSITFYQILKESSTYVFVLQSHLLVSLSHPKIRVSFYSSCNLRFFSFIFLRVFSQCISFFLFFFRVFFSLFSSFIADAPVCASTHEELLGALKHETLTLKCEVDASPPADSFHWTFNSSGEPTDLSAKLQSSEVCCFYHYATTFFFSTRPFSLSLSLRKLSSEKK